MTANKLTHNERIAAGLIAGSFILLTLHTFLFSQASIPGQPPSPSHIEVTILGAVATPGDYELPLGAILSDLLDLAQPTRQADLSRMRKHRKLTHGEEIIILAKKNLIIHINGQKVEVPKGTRVCDLRLWTDLDPQIADQLTSKRLLKDGERL